MNTKKLVIIALLVGMGTVLHAVVPGFVFGMKPDMMLTMMFLGIILFPDFKSTPINWACDGNYFRNHNIDARGIFPKYYR